MGALVVLGSYGGLGSATALLLALLFRALTEQRPEDPPWPLLWALLWPGIAAGRTVVGPVSVRLTPLPAQAHR